MRRRTLVLAVLAVAVLAVGLYLALGRRDHARAGDRAAATDPSDTPGATTRPRPAGTPAPTVTPRRTGGVAAVDPEAPGAIDGTGDAGVDRPTRTYVMDDGTVVRDHRPNPTEPVAITPTPPAQRTLDSAVAAAVYQQISPKVAACGAQVPATSRGKEPFVYVNLTVEIDSGVLTPVDVLPVARDITGPAMDTLVSCVRDGLSTLRVDATGQPDQDRYVLQYPIRIR